MKMKYEIPTVNEFLKLKERMKEVEDAGLEMRIEELSQRIAAKLTCGDTRFIKNKIEFDITGHWDDKYVKGVEKLFQEKGWEELKIEKDLSKTGYYSMVTLKGDVPQPPKRPICRIIREGTVGSCPKCGSTEQRTFFNWGGKSFFGLGKKIGCIQPECDNYWKKNK